jgi:hypothetical protein
MDIGFSGTGVCERTIQETLNLGKGGGLRDICIKEGHLIVFLLRIPYASGRERLMIDGTFQSRRRAGGVGKPTYRTNSLL